MKTLSLILAVTLVSAGCRIVPPEPIEAVQINSGVLFMLPDNYAYRQDNPIWARDKIGDTDDSLMAYGCTISGVAMAASNLTQTEISPQLLNQQLSDVGGFTERGWLIWSKVSEVTEGKVQAEYYDAPNHADIQSCMYEGGYPLLKIYLPGQIVHWVTVVGSTSDEYLIRDPLVGGANQGPIKLSERSSKILGVRCIRLARQE